MSESKGVASVWGGIADSDQALDDYLTFTFNEDGEAIPCQFGKDFGIDWYDEDFLEASKSDYKTRSFQELLAKHSGGPGLITKLVRLVGKQLSFDADTIVILYDFVYDGRVPLVEGGAVSLRFLGTVPYWFGRSE
jgi:hypothetical protein